MADNKKSFILYCDQKGVWDKLNNEQAGKLIKHIIAYVNDENPKTDDFITELAFEPIKQHLKRDLKKWEKQYEQRVEAGKKSAESRKRNATSVNERSISSTDNVNVNGSVNGSVNVNATVNEIKNISIEIFDDEIWVEQMKVTHKGKDIKQAWKECYAHHSADPLSKRFELWQWKQKLNTWLTLKKSDKKHFSKPLYNLK
jgi:hypothetical protein